MSGGVDSSTTAALLVERGYRVIGIMMRLWSEPPHPSPPIPLSPLLFSEQERGEGAQGEWGEVSNRCCSPAAVADARGVCQNLGFPFYLLNFESDFKTHVVDFFLDGYARGITPNPCLECNRQVKFGTLLEKARALGADYLATGHYARVVARGGRFHLLKGVDARKDQSYALAVLTQAQLAHALFPLGDYTKDETRALARRFGLRVSEKVESQDLCFVSDGDYRNFLRRNIPTVLHPGHIEDARGNVLGRHAGIAFFTIGQREGLRIAASKPLYVRALDPARNVVIVGTKEELGKRELIARDLNWIGGEPPREGARVTAKIRYRAPTTECAVYPQARRVVFDEPLRDITPGQAVVLFNGEECLGGGIIESAA